MLCNESRTQIQTTFNIQTNSIFIDILKKYFLFIFSRYLLVHNSMMKDRIIPEVDQCFPNLGAVLIILAEEVLVLITIVHLAEVGTNETIHHQETDETTCHHQTKE